MLYLGIDGGGTKSRLIAEDEAGRLYGPYIGGATNLNSNSKQQAADVIRGLIDRLLAESGLPAHEPVSFCIGSAGVDIPSDVDAMEEVLDMAGVTIPRRVVNDVEIVLESETGGKPGIIIISGTGSIAMGKNAKGATHRVGGWGHVLGDEGSGYWIAKTAISRCLMSYDGRYGPTGLTELFCRYFQLECIADVMGVVYRPDFNKSELAAASRCVDEAAIHGDRTANSILHSAAEYLSEMAAVLMKQMELPLGVPIVLSGGMLHGSRRLRELVQRKLNVLSDTVTLNTNDPCMGAIMIAKSLQPHASR